MKKVGILGVSGKIGWMAAKALEGKCRIRGGSRTYQEAYQDLREFEWQQTDLYDRESLESFCSGCDVLLNCTGPAGIVKDRVALVCGGRKIPYVDTSDVILTDSEIARLLPEDGVYVVGAGYVPGLGSLLVKWLTEQEFDQLNRVKCFQGGRQRFSEIAFTDIVLTALEGKGKGDSYYRKGRILKEHNPGAISKLLPGILKPIWMKAFLSQEMAAVSEHCQVGELHWMNMVSDQEFLDLVLSSVQLLMTEDRDQALPIIQDRARSYGAKDAGEEKEWSRLLLECRGLRKGERKECILSYAVDKEEEACGMVAALAVSHLLEQAAAPGIYRLYELVSSEEIGQMLQDPPWGTFLLEPEVGEKGREV